MQRRRLAIGLVIVLVASVATISFIMRQQDDAKPIEQGQYSAKKEVTFDKTQYSLDSPTSPWLVVNKRRPLNPKDFAPQLGMPQVGLRLAANNPEMQVSQQIVPALQQLFAAAKQAGRDLIIASGYRSYQTQVTVYNNEVKRNGQQVADQESARPGYSEHQTGLAVDIGAASRKCEVESCFGDMPEGQWLAANAYRYGFIIRYSQNNEATTGYTYEPWHLRYVGTELANELHKQGNPPLETYFNLGAAPDYQ